MNNRLKKIALLVGDVLMLYVSLYLALVVRYKGDAGINDWLIHIAPFTSIFIFWIIIFYIFDLYNLHIAVNNTKFYQQTFRALAVTGLISVLFFYFNPNIGIAPKTNLAVFLIVFFILFTLWRRVFNSLLKSYLPKNNILIIGLNRLVEELVDSLQENKHLGYNISLIIGENGKTEHDGIKITSKISDLNEIIKENKISTILLASDPHHSDELRSLLFSALPLKINIVSLINFYEIITGKIPIEAINKMWFLENLSEGNKKLFNIVKRTYDIVLAIFIFAVSIIFWLIIGLIIKLESKGPVFFKQTRVGQNNINFKVYKFRTMKSTEYKTPTETNDKRVTKFGKFLRKSRIDEIPQVINVILGEMSFVGPRPERPHIADELKKEIPFYNERLLVKPGVTGWDQVSGEYHSPNKEDTLKKLQYDLFYVKNRSIYLDISIILKTIATVINRSGM